MAKAIEDNLKAVQDRIAAACARVGRSVDEVTLVCVTKTVGLAEIRKLYEAGATHFGENRVPVGPEKVEQLQDLDCTWHFIGHLQRNKAAQALSGFRIVHSLESLKLAAVLQKEAEKRDLSIDVFLEVNVAGEESKYGLAPEEAEAMVLALAKHDRLHPRGLMTMAPYFEQAEQTRPVFSKLRVLAEDLRAATGAELHDLSMGMSNDFEIAIEEGATLVRVGSALFA